MLYTSVPQQESFILQIFSSSCLHKKYFLSIAFTGFFLFGISTSAFHLGAHPHHHYSSDARSDSQSSDTGHPHVGNFFAKRYVATLQTTQLISTPIVIFAIVPTQNNIPRYDKNLSSWSSRAPPHFSISS